MSCLLLASGTASNDNDAIRSVEMLETGGRIMINIFVCEMLSKLEKGHLAKPKKREEEREGKGQYENLT